MKNNINVYILSYCRRIDLFYGTELIFKTLRVGFPNANVTVVDNASLPEARKKVARLARKSDCHFEQIKNPGIRHHEFLEQILRKVAHSEHADRPLVFLDPDICLWKNCESFDFPGLMAGKLIYSYNDDIMECVMMSRLHTSFLWIPNPGKLWAEITRLRKKHFDFQPFMSISVKMGKVWVRYDTGACLYHAIPNTMSAFTESKFDYFDHLYCGSHLDLLDPVYAGNVGDFMRSIHDDAKKGNLKALKGIWRAQNRIWRDSYDCCDDA